MAHDGTIYDMYQTLFLFFKDVITDESS